MNINPKMLGEDPIGKLLLRLSIPATIGMIVNGLYNLTDAIFVGHGAGSLAIGGLTIAFPLQILIGAFAQTYGIGAASIISRRLGEKREHEAAHVAVSALVFSFLTAVLVTVSGLIFLKPILTAFGATESILPFGIDYMTIVFLGAPFISPALTGSNISTAEGQAKVAMTIMIIGTGLNLILDPIFIFVFHMGIKGAALATVISQFSSFLFIVIHYARGRSNLAFTKKSFKLKFCIFKEIIIIGIPTFAKQASGSIVALVVNNSLGFYGGDMAISAYGIINRLLMFIFMPILGVVQGYQPIAGYNYGAKNFKRLTEVNRLAFMVTTIMALSGFAVLQLIPDLLIGLFTTDQQLINLSVIATEKITIALPLMGIQIIGATYFQSIGKAKPAIFLGLSRQLVFLIPSILILPGLLGLKGIWYSVPIADTLATVITVFWIILTKKTSKTAASPA